MMTNNHHNPVMFSESIDGLDIHPNGIYVDATFGRGGHTQGILDQLGESGQVIACLLYTSPSPRDLSTSRMPSSA